MFVRNIKNQGEEETIKVENYRILEIKIDLLLHGFEYLVEKMDEFSIWERNFGISFKRSPNARTHR